MHHHSRRVERRVADMEPLDGRILAPAPPVLASVRVYSSLGRRAPLLKGGSSFRLTVSASSYGPPAPVIVSWGDHDAASVGTGPLAVKVAMVAAGMSPVISSDVYTQEGPKRSEHCMAKCGFT